ncbi:uncharacterized protein LOC129318490 isoform X2 [Prosopis cineraria]|uniref:uncharacterized protein LOC129318490 isoform X2 n=1 Tax=Prosopis cineraria TaxID=364024 RepID=UPI0024104E5A|nr:uncharacterized protein LOC129318490 isoform X2 [Prosopis cineraria]
MDEAEFRRVLQLFPVVRSRDYCAESGPRQSTSSSRSAQDELKEWQDAWDGGDRELDIKGNEHDEFWSKLKAVAERKVGAEEAERFCEAFQKIHKKLVYEELTEDAARKFIKLVIEFGEDKPMHTIFVLL